MNEAIVDKVIKAAYVLTALIFFNLLAVIYDAQWIQMAIIIDSAVVVSFTGISIDNKLKGGNKNEPPS